MDTRRLEAFSDGVPAILITIMVFEMKIAHGVDFAALWPLHLLVGKRRAHPLAPDDEFPVD